MIALDLLEVLQVTEGKERLERILAAIQDAFMSLDARQRYSFVNANAAVMLGAKKEGNHPNQLATQLKRQREDSKSDVARNKRGQP